ncbi:3-dehydroquinate synthase [Evansella vedderi]|uniref:3-dehydroquinate synthase n=1 Tax=Evansella vedderi TaxID=38282 RepID=A0ABU0A1W5_9BACI|nr:3-dehydroquinate synthase [Evansella vedderi]MDQ0257474.1 3-dehydroquinate synthase [Evansella vedderi]
MNLQVNSSVHPYSIIIEPGSRKQLYEYIIEQTKKHPTSFLVITDDCVADLYLEEVLNSFPNHIRVETSIVPHGEKAKSFQQYENLLTAALQFKLDRGAMIIALGGGVVGDLAGFVAATYMRGIPFVQVPTTLLAHDSSVGGKVGINHQLGKNMVGAFHQPSLVLYDPELLMTLPEHEWRSGFAEVIKHGFIADKEFLEWLRRNVTSFQHWDMNILSEMIYRSIAVKAKIVEEDEKEAGNRAFLNFGHTLGHAIEAELGYGEITHGEAVAIGMKFALAVSEKVFHVNLNYETYLKMLESLGYDLTIPDVNIHKLLDRMKVDKKSYNQSIRFVLLKEFGNPELIEITEEILLEELSMKKGG